LGADGALFFWPQARDGSAIITKKRTKVCSLFIVVLSDFIATSYGSESVNSYSDFIGRNVTHPSSSWENLNLI
jgi:hypothetical protein